MQSVTSLLSTVQLCCQMSYLTILHIQMQGMGKWSKTSAYTGQYRWALTVCTTLSVASFQHRQYGSELVAAELIGSQAARNQVYGVVSRWDWYDRISTEVGSSILRLSDKEPELIDSWAIDKKSWLPCPHVCSWHRWTVYPWMYPSHDIFHLVHQWPNCHSVSGSSVWNENEQAK